jgi:NAD-dependent dihydropyrimidine dehydrogenase PreA subunit
MNPMPENTRINAINALLPQTQCTRCGYQGCLPYAQAIATRAAAINQCPPGGAKTIAALAKLLDTPILPLNPKHGIEQPLTVARIVEDICIGCTKCIQVCPVDAIVGMQKNAPAASFAFPPVLWTALNWCRIQADESPCAAQIPASPAHDLNNVISACLIVKCSKQRVLKPNAKPYAVVFKALLRANSSETLTR